MSEPQAAETAEALELLDQHKAEFKGLVDLIGQGRNDDPDNYRGAVREEFTNGEYNQVYEGLLQLDSKTFSHFKMKTEVLIDALNKQAETPTEQDCVSAFLEAYEYAIGKSTETALEALNDEAKEAQFKALIEAPWEDDKVPNPIYFIEYFTWLTTEDAAKEEDPTKWRTYEVWLTIREGGLPAGDTGFVVLEEEPAIAEEPVTAEESTLDVEPPTATESQRPADQIPEADEGEAATIPETVAEQPVEDDEEDNETTDETEETTETAEAVETPAGAIPADEVAALLNQKPYKGLLVFDPATGNITYARRGVVFNINTESTTGTVADIAAWKKKVDKTAQDAALGSGDIMGILSEIGYAYQDGGLMGAVMVIASALGFDLGGLMGQGAEAAKKAEEVFKSGAELITGRFIEGDPGEKLGKVRMHYLALFAQESQKDEPNYDSLKGDGEGKIPSDTFDILKSCVADHAEGFQRLVTEVFETVANGGEDALEWATYNDNEETFAAYLDEHGDGDQISWTAA